MPSFNAISPEKLSRLVGTAKCPALVDLRLDEDFDADPRLIPGSVRRPYATVDDWADAVAGRSVVAICHKGRKLSEGVAAWLRHRSIAAEILDGGFVAWADAGLPLIENANIPARDRHGHTVWVTRNRPKVDRLACPWLIRRFVDPHAGFLFVTASEVEAVADRFAATPFDIEGAFWSHRGARCTFDTMLAEFGLAMPALDRLATIVRGADTNRPDLAPEAAGLLALSLGLSRQYADDLAQLDAALGMYDAFYRWCRDAGDEGHDWPPRRPAGAAQ